MSQSNQTPKKRGPGRPSRAEELGLFSLLERSVPDSRRKALIKRLLDIADGDDAKNSLKAIEILLAYIYGKPAQTVSIDAKVETEYELVWSDDKGEAPEAPPLTDGSNDASESLQGVVVRTTLGQD
jgi:hypothetical protein